VSTSILPAVRRPPVVSKGWVQLAALVSLSGFFVLVLMGFLTYQSSPPTPQRVVSASGQTVFTGADIRAGQDVFLRNGLMESGSIFGHGAYLGPDFTADYLQRSAYSVGGDWLPPGSASWALRRGFVVAITIGVPPSRSWCAQCSVVRRVADTRRTTITIGAPAGAPRAATTSLACIDGHE
jgi:hypothetical protein